MECRFEFTTEFVTGKTNFWMIHVRKYISSEEAKLNKNESPPTT